MALLICSNFNEYEPIVICGGDTLKKVFNNNNINSYSLSFSKTKMFKTLSSMKKIIKQNDVNILHCHDNTASLYGYLVKKLYKLDVKIISHIHNCYPFLKEEGINKKIDKVMGMYDAMPTLANMFNFNYKYALGHDIFNTDNNIVVFPNGNWVTDKMYYNAQKEEYLLLKDSVVNDDEIEKNKEYANKLLEVSDSIIVYDLEAGGNNEKK